MDTNDPMRGAPNIDLGFKVANLLIKENIPLKEASAVGSAVGWFAGVYKSPS